MSGKVEVRDILSYLMRIFQLPFWCFLFLMIQTIQPVWGQAVVKVNDIQFKGNQRTKEKTMTRELTFQKGDSIALSELSKVVEENRQRLQNTNLFSKVEANIQGWTSDNSVDILFTVREQWYLTGYAIFDLADRNFNVWWVEQNRRLNRVDYGFRVKHDNLSGNADELTAALTLGYTRRAEIEYNLPAINKSRTLGLHTKLFSAQRREIHFRTIENKFEFFSNENFQIKTFIGELGLTYRKKLDFLDGKSSQNFFTLAYTLRIDKRKQRPYSKEGWFLESVFRKHGLGIFKDLNALSLSTTVAKYFEFSPKISLETIGKVQFMFNRDQLPYYNSRALGLKPDFLSGYEFYVVDGMDFSYVKTSLRYQIVDWECDFKLIDPFYSEHNPLSNTFLWGGGIGIDIVAYYDKIFQIQYSFNHLLESGIFLHFKHRF